MYTYTHRKNAMMEKAHLVVCLFFGFFGTFVQIVQFRYDDRTELLSLSLKSKKNIHMAAYKYWFVR